MVFRSISRSTSDAGIRRRRPSLTDATFLAVAHWRTVTGRNPSRTAVSSIESSPLSFGISVTSSIYSLVTLDTDVNLY